MNQSQQIIDSLIEAMTTADKVDMPAKYRKFVRLLFEPEGLDMPETGSDPGQVVFKTGTNKKASGITKYPRIRRSDLQYMGPVTIIMMKRLLVDEKDLDVILIHEMMHVYFGHIKQWKEKHGRNFEALRMKLSKRLGREIPRFHDVAKLDINPDLLTKGTKVGIILVVDPNEEHWVGLVTNKIITKELEKVVMVLGWMKGARPALRIYLFRTRHRLQHIRPIQRSVDADIFGDKIKIRSVKPEQVEDLLTMVTQGSPEFLMEIPKPKELVA